jgi:hypothetical protein
MVVATAGRLDWESPCLVGVGFTEVVGFHDRNKDGVWVRLLCGSWDKLKLRDVCVSKLGLSFWQIACSFVAFEDGDLAKCLVTK